MVGQLKVVSPFEPNYDDPDIGYLALSFFEVGYVRRIVIRKLESITNVKDFLEYLPTLPRRFFEAAYLLIPESHRWSSLLLEILNDDYECKHGLIEVQRCNK